MTNTKSGEVKIDKKCGFQFLPMLMVEVIKASNRPAEEVSAMRGEHIAMMEQVARRTSEAIIRVGKHQTMLPTEHHENEH